MVARETSIAEGLAALGLPASSEEVAKLSELAEILKSEAIPMGYLGPQEAGRIRSRHILESAAILGVIGGRQPIVDVGSGGGLPGLVLGCLGARMVLIEAQARRAGFLRRTSARLRIDAEVMQSRAEDVGRSEARETFSAATARALASIPVALELCLPLVAVGGSLVLLATYEPTGATNRGIGEVPARGGERGVGSAGAAGPQTPANGSEGHASDDGADPKGLRSRDGGSGARSPSDSGARGAAPDAGGGSLREPAPARAAESPSVVPSRLADGPEGPVARVAAQLGGSQPVWHALAVPGAPGPRWVMIVEKLEPTPDRFPRRSGVPQRRPLG